MDAKQAALRRTQRLLAHTTGAATSTGSGAGAGAGAGAAATDADAAATAKLERAASRSASSAGVDAGDIATLAATESQKRRDRRRERRRRRRQRGGVSRHATGAAAGAGAAGTGGSSGDSSDSSSDGDSSDSAGGEIGDGRLVGSLSGGGTGAGLSSGVDVPTKWNGWGYADTQFVLSEESGHIELTGERYATAFERDRVLPKLRPFVEDVLGIDVNAFSPGRTEVPDVPEPNVNRGFMDAIEGHCLEVALDAEARIRHSHGHTCQEVYALRFGTLHRVPDAVVFAGCHEHVEKIVAAAVANNVCIMPFGGGTSVSGGLEVPEDETRMIAVVSTARMRRIKWVDRESMMACVEAGATGVDLETRLAAQGVCTGHEPDSAEFSSLGGWIATRASGMKKNVYGNIEDIVINVKMVTAKGVVEKGTSVPRSSLGPDVLQMVLGSEGTLGIVTEAIVRLQPLPEVKVFGSIAFPNFGAGVAAMREVAARRVAPASIRLVDNTQFQMGQAMKPAPTSPLKTQLLDAAKKYYVTSIKGFDPLQMCACTLLFQGTAAQVKEQQRVIYAIGAKYGGMAAGAEAGERGYFLTFMIAYLRDYAINYGFLAESFETSVPWSNVLALCHGVKDRIRRAAAKRGVRGTPFISCRVTQTYDTGACVYFYFGFLKHGLDDPPAVFSAIEHEARDEILSHGGSLSHHHGIGKHRKEWMHDAIGDTGITMLRGLKEALDPTNTFGNGNLI